MVYNTNQTVFKDAW
jgi:hypothetical protein